MTLHGRSGVSDALGNPVVSEKVKPYPTEPRCVGCRYHTRDGYCRRFTDCQVDVHAWSDLCRGNERVPRRKEADE